MTLSKIAGAMLSFVLLTGCGATMKLEDRWKPLIQVEEAPAKLVQPGVTTTIDETCYVHDLQSWLQDYPMGSVAQEALLRHERTHSVRQHAFPAGVDAWLALYLVDRAFRWQEEQAGWAREISYNVNHGYYVNVDVIASILNQNYGPVGGRMVSFEDAKAWVQSVVANPLPDEDLH